MTTKKTAPPTKRTPTSQLPEAVLAVRDLREAVDAYYEEKQRRLRNGLDRLSSQVGYAIGKTARMWRKALDPIDDEARKLDDQYMTETVVVPRLGPDRKPLKNANGEDVVSETKTYKSVTQQDEHEKALAELARREITVPYWPFDAALLKDKEVPAELALFDACYEPE